MSFQEGGGAYERRINKLSPFFGLQFSCMSSIRNKHNFSLINTLYFLEIRDVAFEWQSQRTLLIAKD